MTAPTTQCEQMLARALAYLSGAGLTLTLEHTLQAMRIVEEILADEAVDDEYARLMQRVSEIFVLPEVSLPLLVPVINRGSIGYGAS